MPLVGKISKGLISPARISSVVNNQIRALKRAFLSQYWTVEARAGISALSSIVPDRTEKNGLVSAGGSAYPIKKQTYRVVALQKECGLFVVNWKRLRSPIGPLIAYVVSPQGYARG